MTTEVLKKQFELYAYPTSTNKNYELNDDGTLTIEGIASTTNKDLQDDIVLPSAIESMKKQLHAGLNLHGDHTYGLFDGVIGAITDVIETDSYSLKIRARILPKYASEIRDMINCGVKLGLSIGGRVTEYTTLDDYGWEIKDIALHEISLTSMPANWDTYGTITTSKGIVKSTCLTGACYTVVKNEVKKMTTKTDENEALTKNDVIALINEGMIELKEELANETVNAVTKQLDKIVTDAIKDALNSQSNNDDDSDDNGKEDDDNDEEEKSLTLDDVKNVISSELASLKSELTPSVTAEDISKTIAETVNNTVSDEMSKLFKELDNSRNPDFQYNENNISSSNTNDGDVVKTEFTSREIAETLVNKQSQNDFLKNLIE